jgi:hypothetical protein
MPSFFDIPAELRYMVYDSLWHDTSTIRLCLVPGLSHFAEYDGPLRKDQELTIGHPVWLLVNKAFMLEGIDQFHTLGHSNVALNTKPSAGHSCLRFLADENIYDRKLFSPVLAPYNSRRVRLDLRDWETNWPTNPPKLIKVTEDDEYWCNSLIADLVADARETKEMKKFEIILKDFSYETWSKGWVDIDLTRLGRIIEPLAPYLDWLEVRLGTRWHRWHHSEKDEVMDFVGRRLVKKVNTMERNVLSGMVRDLDMEAFEEHPVFRVRILHAALTRLGSTAMLLRGWGFVWSRNT